MIACVSGRQRVVVMARTATNKEGFGLWLASARAARGWSQDDLADQADVTQEYISGLERGIRNPSKKLVHVLARVLAQPDADSQTKKNILQSALHAAFLPSEMTSSPVRQIVRDIGYGDDNLTPEDEEALEGLFENAVIGLMEKKKRAGS